MPYVSAGNQSLLALMFGDRFWHHLGATRVVGSLCGATIDQLPADMQARVKGMFIVGDADEVGVKVRELLDAGLDGIVVNMPDAHDLEAVALAGSVLSKIFA